MGAQESRLAAEAGVAAKGFHVLRVAENSPAADAGVEPFFDYIVGVGGESVGENGDGLSRRLEESEGRSISLQVYSARKQEVRNVRVVPNRKWSTVGPSKDANQQPSLLGLSLRLCSPANALDNVWHILEIVEGSPAQDAGLVPFGDWVIGYAGGVLRGEDDFYRVVEDHEDRPLRLFVYNADYEVTREVVIVPNRSWGTGEGLLGCSIGFGLLHRIPKTSSAAPITTPASHPHFVDRALPSYSDATGAAFSSGAGYAASAGVDVVPTFSSADGSAGASGSESSAPAGQRNGFGSTSSQRQVGSGYPGRPTISPVSAKFGGPGNGGSVVEVIVEEEEMSPSVA